MAQNFNMVTPQRVTLTLAVILTASNGALGRWRTRDGIKLTIAVYVDNILVSFPLLKQSQHSWRACSEKLGSVIDPSTLHASRGHSPPHSSS